MYDTTVQDEEREREMESSGKERKKQKEREEWQRILSISRKKKLHDATGGDGSNRVVVDVNIYNEGKTNCTQGDDYNSIQGYNPGYNRNVNHNHNNNHGTGYMINQGFASNPHSVPSKSPPNCRNSKDIEMGGYNDSCDSTAQALAARNIRGGGERSKDGKDGTPSGPSSVGSARSSNDESRDKLDRDKDRDRHDRHDRHERHDNNDSDLSETFVACSSCNDINLETEVDTQLDPGEDTTDPDMYLHENVINELLAEEA